MHDTDDPAIWINEKYPDSSLILGTDKDKENGGVYIFDLKGNIDSTKSKFGMKRVNNIDIANHFTYLNKDIAIAVKRELNESMMAYGYDIINTLVTDIDPDIQVKNAMNRINAADREKTAAEYEAEASRIRIVAKAKAEAESKRLQGQGIADQRREIARGLVESVDVLNKVGINSQEASALIVVTQHYDTLQAIGSDTNSNLILLPNSPQAGSDMLNNMVASFTASNQVGEAMKNVQKKKKDDGARPNHDTPIQEEE